MSAWHALLIVLVVLVVPAAVVLAGLDQLRLLLDDRRQRRRGHPWKQLAVELQLSYRAGIRPTSHRLLGTMSTRPVLVRMVSQMRLSRADMPKTGIKTIITLRPLRPLASAHHYTGPGSGLRDAGFPGSSGLLSWAEAVTIRHNRIVVEQRGMLEGEMPTLLERLDALCADLEDRAYQPWAEAAARFELAYSLADPALSPSDPPEPFLARPDDAALPLTVRIVRMDARVETIIQARLTTRLTGLALVRRRQPDDVRGFPIGQPILDAMVIVEGALPWAVVERLRDPESCAVLLSVVHAWPGSTISAEAITLRVPGRASAGLCERIDEVLALHALITG